MNHPAWTHYTKSIAEIRPDLDPMAIEDWLVIKFRTLDHLSREDFEREVHEAAELVQRYGANWCADPHGSEGAEDNADCGCDGEDLRQAYHALAVPVENGRTGDAIDVDTVYTIEEAVETLQNAGFNVIEPGYGGDWKAYEPAEVTPVFGWPDEGIGVITITVAAR